ncbi:MAG: uracil-DNA glycosylase [Bacteroidia bacterium]|jgi:uracil-DNA glycosylase|nr:uracil-DNA glycosylase [Bacteroidia bacterium]
MSKQVDIEESWHAALSNEFNATYFNNLITFLKEEKKAGKVIYPSGSQIFAAFNHTPVHQVKVVIIGQDPYHGHGQANGLCFSVNKGIPIPPSLQNIFKELANDLAPDYEIPTHGDLSNWAKQGVLLLNATLTVEKDKAGSHQQKGWEQFTDAVIRHISERGRNIVFILWGRYAQQKASFIPTDKHLVLTAAHPSPFSAYQGFFGCKHFSKTNDWLEKKGLSKIQW